MTDLLTRFSDIDALVLALIALVGVVTYLAIGLHEQIQKQWFLLHASEKRIASLTDAIRQVQDEIREMQDGRRNMGRRHLDKPTTNEKEKDYANS